MTTYEFLVPVARAFMAEFRDSRYLRWAIRDYRRLANAYFYRSLEISPQTSAQLVDVGDPFSVSPGYTNPTGSAESVLEKYKITPAAPIAVPVAKKEAPVPQIATATPSPVPSAAPPAAAPASVDDAVADTVTDAKANDTMEYAKQLSKQHEEVSPPAEAPVKADAQANPDRYPATTSEGLPPMPDALPVTPAAK